MVNQDPIPDGQMPAAGRFLGGVFGLVFLGIGVSVILFLWSSPFGEFGSPPLFFRVFGSLLAVAFVAAGGTVAFGAVKGGSPGARRTTGVSRTAPQGPSGQPAYGCPRCGAPLGSDADVSPHGDVKCTHCDSWFNIHAR